MTQAEAKLKNLNIAPRKVRLVCGIIRGMHVNAALAQLQISTLRASDKVAKLLRSAISNAKNKNMDVNKLVIKSIFVNQGPMLKRFLPRARGSATEIQKKFSHITIILEESKTVKAPSFAVIEKKRVKAAPQTTSAKPKAKKEVEEKIGGEKKGFAKKIFNRKSV